MYAEHTPFGSLIIPFKLFYDLIYAGSVLSITLLYILIYKEIYLRRKIKQNRKREILKNGCFLLAATTTTANPASSDNGMNKIYDLVASSQNGGSLIKTELANTETKFNKVNRKRNDSLKSCCGYFEKKGKFHYLKIKCLHLNF